MQSKVIHQLRFPTLSVDAWRMNVLVIDTTHLMIYIGNSNELIRISFGGLQLDDIQTLFTIEPDDLINQLHMYETQLFAITMNSMVYIIDTAAIQLTPYILQGKYNNFDDCSIWSIDVCEHYIAVGSNSKIISLWSRKHINLADTDVTHLQDRIVRNKYTQLDLDSTSYRYSIMNNKHNIPCVKFSPCMQYLAACSIDMTIKIFNVSNGIELYTLKFTEWVWGVQWKCTDQNAQSMNKYTIYVSLAHSIVILECIDGVLQEMIRMKPSIEQQFQRYQMIRIVDNTNLIMAVPLHGGFIDFYEVQYIAKQYYFKVHKLPLQGQLVSANYAIVPLGQQFMVCTLNYQGVVSIMMAQLGSNQIN